MQPKELQKLHLQDKINKVEKRIKSYENIDRTGTESCSRPNINPRAFFDKTKIV